PQSDMPNCMSKLMLLGMTLSDVVMRSTVGPAKAIGHYPELGTLGVGRVADIAVLDLQSGVFAFKDAWDAKRLGEKRLECLLTVRDGKVVYESLDRVAQPKMSQVIYDLLLKNGHVIDSANHRNGRFDVAVVGNKIVQVAPNLPASHARITIEAGEFYVTAGMIAIAAGTGVNHPDTTYLPNGFTTVVDGKSRSATSGHPKTQVLASAKIDGTPPLSAGLLDSMSKLLNQQMPVEKVVDLATVSSARAIGRPDLGTLSEGSVADIALLELQPGGRRLRCVLTVRNGAVVWDSEGLAATDWIKAGPYSNYK
ncbi:MAG: amidohydrolase family protein, partial [Bryobacteraceae bacterium]